MATEFKLKATGRGFYFVGQQSYQAKATALVKEYLRLFQFWIDEGQTQPVCFGFVLPDETMIFNESSLCNDDGTAIADKEQFKMMSDAMTNYLNNFC